MDKNNKTAMQDRWLDATSSGVAAFEYDPKSNRWTWSDQAAEALGIPEEELLNWEQLAFPDDLLKMRAAAEEADTTGAEFRSEFRINGPGKPLRWIAARGKYVRSKGREPRLRGTAYEITDRKSLEARLLAVNETLEARVAEARREARALEVLNQIGIAVAAEHNLDRLVQLVTDAGVELSHAQFGAFFYNVIREDGEAYTLYTLSGAPREAFERFPMPRNSAVFEPTFRGEGVLRSDDIQADARYGKNPPYNGMPPGHLPVRSYLAVPVTSRGGKVIGGLFFGHAQTRVFTERAEQIVKALAAQAAVAIDNARLYETSQREIAARSKTELELQILNQALEERAQERARELGASLVKLAATERNFNILVEAVTDYAIYMLDPDGRVVSWNAGAARIKGYDRREIVGRHFSEFYSAEDRNARIPWRAMAAAVEKGRYEAEGWRIRKDGSKFWAAALINAIRGEKGELLGFAKITRDLTERRAAEERAQQAQKMEAIGHLTGGVAHDFNNLLTIIIGNLETLQRNAAGPAPDLGRLKRSSENAMRGARRAEALTQRLLAFSRQQPLVPKPVDLGRLVTGMSELLRRTLGEQVSVETVTAAGLWRAEADPNQLELAILNLAVNARDAMPDGGKLTIETQNVYFDEDYAAAQAEVLPGQYVMLAITDTGCGMSADVKAKAFDPFFTTKDVGHGTGLGLSQVYGFVKQSRGNVKIYSEVGEGTTIKLYLPRIHAQPEPTREIEGAIPKSSTGETVLIVEDDADVRAYSYDTLCELGYTVLQAQNGEDALRLLSVRPDVEVLFTDVGLPGGMNGRQLADAACAVRPELKVLFTSGYARNAIVHEGRLDPGVELLPKPFNQSALASKLRDILDAKRAPPGRILLVEDEALIQMLAVEYLEEAGFAVDVAGSATEAMNKLALVPGGVNAVIVDLGLPDRSGDVLVREIRAVYPSIPIVVATGQAAATVTDMFKGQERIGLISKPYLSSDLLDALRQLGLLSQQG